MMASCRVGVIVAAVCPLLVVIPITQARAQGSASPRVAVHVRVADSAGTPVTGAEVSVVRGLSDVVAHALTDERGEQTLNIARGGDAELVVRKLGYLRASSFFADSTGPISLAITLVRSPHSLDTVKVTAAEDVRRKSYYIDADAIEHSPRLVVDALDVVMKLRPDMIWGRRGHPDTIDQHVSAIGQPVNRSVAHTVFKALQFGYCPPVQDVWVNGTRIADVPFDPLAAAKRNGDGMYINVEVATVLASIKPEHIAEMEYHPCSDAGAAPHSTNAIMVQLKDGIGFDPGAGSYVRALATAASGVVAASAPRILGVFDEDSGEPLSDVEVVDVSTGTVARTTTTGTVSLAFLAPGTRELQLRHGGYTSQTLPVTISPSDTTPITVVLPRAKAPPARTPYAPSVEKRAARRAHAPGR